MKIFDCGKIILECEIKPDMLIFDDYASTLNCEFIEYRYPGLVQLINPLIDDIVSMQNPFWSETDYNNTSTYFYNMNDETFFAIEVRPKRISEDEKINMLNSSSKLIREDGYSDYLETLDIIDRIDLFFKNEEVGIMGIYNLSLTEEEREYIQ